jgi:hypothetical protein
VVGQEIHARGNFGHTIAGALRWISGYQKIFCIDYDFWAGQTIEKRQSPCFGTLPYHKCGEFWGSVCEKNAACFMAWVAAQMAFKYALLAFEIKSFYENLIGIHPT